VKIGNQLWMAENLKYKPGSGEYCTYDKDQGNVAKYGYLYNWEAAKKACPTGWHLPSKNEFMTLLNNYGGFGNTAYQALLPGGISGFSAPFGGWRTASGNFYGIDGSTYFWSSSAGDAVSAWNMYLSGEDKEANMDEDNKGCGYSVRCIHDK
jgi:uncharacterized protein (TIGR02145 family)